MFHIKICHYNFGDYIKFRLRTKNFTKQAIIKAHSAIRLDNFGLYDESRYMLSKVCKEICRDELHRKYGNDWRKYEQPKLVWNSYISAINRMQPAYINKR